MKLLNNKMIFTICAGLALITLSGCNSKTGTSSDYALSGDEQKSENIAPVILNKNLEVSFSEHNITNIQEPNKMQHIDMDSDGDIDFVVSSNSDGNDSLTWFENDGSQHFIEHNITTSYANGWGATPVDIDQDGDIDIILAMEENAFSWYENDGSQQFTEHNLSQVTGYSWWTDYGDVDQDGDRDILGVSWDGMAQWYENDGSSHFTEHNLTMSTSSYTYIVMNDIDKDNLNDIVVTDFYNKQVLWYENTNTPNFIEHNITSSVVYSYSVDILDFDKDGDKDIVETGWQQISIFENDGNQNFTEHNVTTSAEDANELVGTRTVDIDDDGDFDIFSSRAWFENKGNYSFKRHEISPFSPYFDMVDIDNDGDQDILSPYYYDNKITWQENLGKNSFYVDENQTAVGTVQAEDADGDTLYFSMNGIDASKFNIDQVTGEIDFKVRPDFENPDDNNGDNIYELNITVTDGNLSDSIALRVIVENIDD